MASLATETGNCFTSIQNMETNKQISTSEDEVRSAVAFSEVSLDREHPVKKTKVPRRILHFSDGTLEEYSTDEEDETDNEPKQPAVDPKTLTWLPWLWYYMVTVGGGALTVADTCGEKLAWMFGITSPKYQYAIDEYHRLQKEEEEEREREEREKQAEQKRLADELLVMEGAVELDSLQSSCQPCQQDQQQSQPRLTISAERGNTSSSLMSNTQTLSDLPSVQKF